MTSVAAQDRQSRLRPTTARPAVASTSGSRSRGEWHRAAIMTPLPTWGMMLTMVASRTLYLALAVWGWGGRSAFRCRFAGGAFDFPVGRTSTHPRRQAMQYLLMCCADEVQWAK